MIKVMIVEDEPPILRSIKNSVESANPEFKVVASAYDGEEAISLLISTKPDVIFTDIRMPVKDGITFLSYVKQNNPDIITVILSGYQEFEYTRKALQLSVFDYLLKPISVTVLSELLGKISERFHNKRNELEKKYIYDLLINDTATKDSGNIRLGYSSYILMLLCAGAFPTFSTDYLIPAREYWSNTNLENIASRFIECIEKVWIFDGKSISEKLVLLAGDENIQNKSGKIASDIFSQLDSSRLPITIVIGNPTTSINNISFISQILRTTLNKRIVIGFSQIIKQSESSEINEAIKKEMPIIDSHIERKLILSIEQSNIKMFKSDLVKLFESWQESTYPQVLVEKLLRHIITLCQRSLPTSSEYESTNLELEINEAISNSCSYDGLFKGLWYIFNELFTVKTRNDTEKDKLMVLMHKIDEYIKANLAKQISNQVLSEKFGLVSSYLSKLFRNYKGISPAEYLVSLRIEKAKELIKSQPDLLVKDIAEIVGYSDPLYFSRIFKKETSMWPSEFKNPRV